MLDSVLRYPWSDDVCPEVRTLFELSHHLCDLIEWSTLSGWKTCPGRSIRARTEISSRETKGGAFLWGDPRFPPCATPFFKFFLSSRSMKKSDMFSDRSTHEFGKVPLCDKRESIVQIESHLVTNHHFGFASLDRRNFSSVSHDPF